MRRRTTEEELDESAPPVAGETSAAAAEEVQRVRHQGKPAPPAAGETSEAVAVKPERARRPDKPQGQAHPAGGRRDRRGGGGQAQEVEQARRARSAGGWRDQRGGSGRSRAAKQDSRLQDTEAHQSDPQMLPREFSGSANNTGWLHHQGSGNDSGMNSLRHPDGRRDGAVRQGGQGLQQGTLQAPEEKRREKVV